MVARGLRYDAALVVAEDISSPFYHCRGFYYAGAYSRLGIVSGKMCLSDPLRLSDEQLQIVDRLIQQNFGVCGKPDYADPRNRDQQGVLYLSGEDFGDGGVYVRWIIAHNDMFYLGAIQHGNDVFLASGISEEIMFRDDGSDALTISGRQYSAAMGSEAYTLQYNPLTGVVLEYSRAPPGKEYGVSELLNSVKQYTFDSTARESVRWIAELIRRSDIAPDEVLVVEMETCRDGRWIGAIERGTVRESETTTIGSGEAPDATGWQVSAN